MVMVELVTKHFRNGKSMLFMVYKHLYPYVWLANVHLLNCLSMVSMTQISMYLSGLNFRVRKTNYCRGLRDTPR